MEYLQDKEGLTLEPLYQNIRRQRYYITEFYNHAGVTEYKSTEYGISFIAKNFFAYIPTDDEIANNQTIARITVIGDTASNYMQSQTAY